MSTTSPVFDSIMRAVSWSEDNGGAVATVRCFSHLPAVTRSLIEEIVDRHSDKGTRVEVEVTEGKLSVSGFQCGSRFSLLIFQS
jgi:hypothetical protein